LRSALDDAGAVGIIDIAVGVAVVGNGVDAVLLVPRDRAASAVSVILKKAVDPSHRQFSDQPKGRWPCPPSEEFRKRALQDEGQPFGVRELLRSRFE